MTGKYGTLLIAESGSELAGALRPWLRESGHQLISVHNIRDVLLTIQNEKVNVVVFDSSLQEPMDYESISLIKGLKSRLPIIVTADENNAVMESRIRRKGIFYYHVKSFGTDELVLAVSNAMSRSAPF